MADVENHEYQLLNAIAQDSMVTQAGMSTLLGIAVGSVNWYIKRLVKRGLVKVSHLDRTRLKYDLTSEGMKVLTQRALKYMESSLQVYMDVRKKAKDVVGELISQGITHVYLDGNDERMDILRLTCIESGITFDDMPQLIMLNASREGFQIVERNVRE